MKVLVTGATGFLGGHVVRLLQAQGHEPVALVRASSNRKALKAAGVSWREASIERGEGLEAALEGIDAVIHAAGLVKARSSLEFHHVNVDGTANLLRAAEARGDAIKAFIYVSSLAAHGFRDDGKPRGADEPSQPVTYYGKSKRAGEEVALRFASKLPVNILRPPAIYGPGDREMFAFFQAARRRVVPFLVSRKHQLSLIYVEDCARALVHLIESPQPSGSIFAVNDGEAHTQEGLAEAIAHALGVRYVGVTVPLPVLNAAAVISERYGRFAGKAVMLNRDKVNELKQPYLLSDASSMRGTGWTPHYDLKRGTEATAKWYREHSWL